MIERTVLAVVAPLLVAAVMQAAALPDRGDPPPPNSVSGSCALHHLVEVRDDPDVSDGPHAAYRCEGGAWVFLPVGMVGNSGRCSATGRSIPSRDGGTTYALYACERGGAVLIPEEAPRRRELGA